MSEISKQTKDLIKSYQEWKNSLQVKENVSTIHVDEVASKVASFYEKLRGIVDWKEEHLLKRSTIERLLKRRMLPKIDVSTGKITDTVSAEPLVLELIRSGHFPNDRIEETKIAEIQKIIDKYSRIINSAPLIKGKSKIQLFQWLSSIAACEIEETLSPSIRERALIKFMYSKIKDGLVISNEIKNKENLTEKEINIQIFISVQKALFDLDSSVISYHLIKYKCLNWSNLSTEEIDSFALNIYDFQSKIDAEINHPLGGKINQICQTYNTPYFIISDIVSDDPFKAEEKIADAGELESLIRIKYNHRLKGMQSRLNRAAFYSTISIFLTNILALILIEIPVTKYFGQFSTMTYIVDVFVPTMLMALLVLTIAPPPKGNLEKVVMETIKVVYQNQKNNNYEVKKLRKRSSGFNFFISLIYLASFALSIGLIVWALSKINFPPFSYIVFIIFLSLIAFAGAKIRDKAKELHMIEQKSGFSAMIIDLFALPIILFGKQLTVRWKKYNFVSTFFNSLIDMPFSVFVEFLEQWRYFLQEKKEKL